MSRLATWLLTSVTLGTLPAQALARPGDEHIRAAVQEVYARPEFTTPEWHDNWLAWLLSWLGALGGAASATHLIILVVCAGLLLLLALYLVRLVRRAVYVRGVRGATAQAEERRRLSGQFRADANAYAQAGDYTAAVRALFLSLVYAYDERGRLAFQPALTNREYLHGFADRPVLADDLRVYVDLLDTNWYGQQPTTASDYQECLARYERLQRA
ncbi:MAG TPA: DUF4129 domain-containing protein [Gemmataceae bacterium]|nr:DUF4129 domain-containing protein [Gemmataceae bacterium]